MDRPQVQCCPECDATQYYPISGSHVGEPARHDNDYRCGRCSATFDEPETRPHGNHGGNVSGLAATLDAMDADDVGKPVTDGGQLTADATLRLTDEGLEMPDWLRGYAGSFTIRTGKVSGDVETTDAGLPDTEYYDGPIAVMPESGDYNPEIPPGHMILTAPGQPEWCYEIIEERTDEPEVATDGGTTITDTKAADMVAEVINGSDAALTDEEYSQLAMVEAHLLGGDTPTETVTDDRLEVASKLRCIADDLERTARQSSADDVDVTLHVSVEETYRGEWGGL